MTEAEFRELLHSLADAWNRQDYATAVDAFAEDVRYADPLRYSFTGRAQLRAFFDDDDGYPQHTEWHTIIFDEKRQIGAAEYTYDGTYRYHGVVLIQVKDKKITRWREYQHVDPRAWTEFASGTVL